MFPFVFLIYRNSIKKAYEQSVKFNALEFDLTFSDDGVELQTSQVKANYSYNQFIAFKEFKNTYCLLLSKDRIIIIPKTQCPEELRRLLLLSLFGTHVLRHRQKSY